VTDSHGDAWGALLDSVFQVTVDYATGDYATGVRAVHPRLQWWEEAHPSRPYSLYSGRQITLRQAMREPIEVCPSCLSRVMSQSWANTIQAFGGSGVDSHG
jgi:hypothetical protein